MRLPVNRFAPLAALTLLAACGGGEVRPDDTIALPTSGPAADYPLVVGTPFTIDGVTHTPIDTMNYDAVGHALASTDGGSSVSAAHKTLPLPSYVEVTALDSGKTILVRLERRGPMRNDRLIELSPGAAAQLGMTGQDKQAVRVRRVNPQEPERALLRSGQAAPARMDTPKSLLTVLNRKLDQQLGIVTPAPVASPNAAPTAVATPKPAVSPKPAASPRPVASPKPEAAAPKPAPRPVATASPTPSTGTLAVQVGAFSSKARADTVATKAGGQVSRVGNVWRVRMGPYASQAEAAAALAKARAAGYSDARIQRTN